MKKAFLVIALLVAIIYGCQHTDTIAQSAYNSILNTSKLESQFFTVDLSKDTTILTRQRAVIKIPKGALDAGGASTVTLEVKEAYTLPDIIKGGLTTTSNGQPLKSGGMIYINTAKGSEAKIVKPLSVATPSPFLDSTMQLYKGQLKDDSTINWVEPASLPPNPQLAKLEIGRQIFQDNCPSCHRVDKDLTGPALAGAIERAPKYYGEADTILRSKLYDWTRNNSKILATGDCYYNDLYKKWNKTQMTVFRGLTDTDLDCLYGYIQNETKRLGIVIPNQEKDPRLCLDSCRVYMAVASDLEGIKRKLEQDSTKLVEYIQMPGGTNPLIEKIIVPPPPELEVVSPLNSNSLYYQFTIKDFGWYNIDVRLDHPDDVQSKLTIHLQGHEHVIFNLYLVVPSINMLLPGGALKNANNDYGFFEANGQIPLPPGVDAYVFAVGEHNDSIFFAGHSFVTSPQVNFTLTLENTNKQAFEAAIKRAGLPKLDITVDETKHAAPLREVIKKLKDYEVLKPKNCNCDCLMNNGSDSVDIESTL